MRSIVQCQLKTDHKLRIMGGSMKLNKSDFIDCTIVNTAVIILFLIELKTRVADRVKSKHVCLLRAIQTVKGHLSL